jgi:hypothetical protein
MKFIGYLNTEEGKVRFPAGRFPRRISAVLRRHPEITTDGDLARLDTYLREKEPWNYDRE